MVEFSQKELVEASKAEQEEGGWVWGKTHVPESRPSAKPENRSRSYRMSSQIFKTEMYVLAVDCVIFEREVVAICILGSFKSIGIVGRTEVQNLETRFECKSYPTLTVWLWASR